MDLPRTASVVVIGGGVVGCSLKDLLVAATAKAENLAVASADFADIEGLLWVAEFTGQV